MLSPGRSIRSTVYHDFEKNNLLTKIDSHLMITVYLVNNYEKLPGNIRNAMKGLDKMWLESVADRGVDAKAALEAFRNYQKW